MKKQLLILPLCLSLSSCTSLKTWWTAHGAQVGQTANLLAVKAATIAGKVILSAATSQNDSDVKANYLDSVAQGVRSLDWSSAITADDIKAVATIWAPDAAHWQYLGQELGSAFNQTSGPTDQRLEAIASGLNVAAATERAQ